MCYLVARHFEKTGCIAIKVSHGPQLVALKRKLLRHIGYGSVELVTISRPMAYLEYAPFYIAATEDAFIEAVTKLCEPTREEPK